MLMFSMRSMGVAKQNSLEAVQQWSLKSNRFAAMFAARTLESELSKLFRDVEDESARGELRDALLLVLKEASPQLDAIAGGNREAEHSAKLKKLKSQMMLEQHLADRIAKLTKSARSSGDKAVYNSLFLTDGRGTNVGIAFSDPNERLDQSPVGRNFAYRSYFTGEREDGDDAKPSSTYSATTHTHLSSSFRSTSTGKWKVAISAPIWPESREKEGDEADSLVAPLGVLVLTINLGDFDLLANEDSSGDSHADSQSSDRGNAASENGDGSGNAQIMNANSEMSRLAVLIDGREGTQRGTLLQHPVLKAMESRFRATKVTQRVPQIDDQQLAQLREGMVDYRDPAAEMKREGSSRADGLLPFSKCGCPSVRGDMKPVAATCGYWFRNERLPSKRR